MNTIPHHHRWPAEGSAQQQRQEKVIEGQIFRGGGRACFILFYVYAGFKEDVCMLYVHAGFSQSGSSGLGLLGLIVFECN